MNGMMKKSPRNRNIRYQIQTASTKRPHTQQTSTNFIKEHYERKNYPANMVEIHNSFDCSPWNIQDQSLEIDEFDISNINQENKGKGGGSAGTRAEQQATAAQYSDTPSQKLMRTSIDFCHPNPQHAKYYHIKKQKSAQQS